jgi:hypothetical protein
VLPFLTTSRRIIATEHVSLTGDRCGPKSLPGQLFVARFFVLLQSRSVSQKASSASHKPSLTDLPKKSLEC